MRTMMLALVAVLSMSALSMPGSALAQEPQAAAPVAAVGAAAALDPADGALVLRPSFLWGFIKEDRTHGFGGGLELLRYPNASGWRWGVFAEGLGQLDGAWRVAGGLSGGYGVFGTQIGLAHRTVGDYAAATSLQIAKTLTLGPAGIALRVTLPIHHHQPAQLPAMERQGVEMALVFQLGWSFTVRGVRPRHTHSCGSHGHGRSGDLL
ncbi:MAG: hypothetical protein KF901_14050 [Myxococcales bacterium]|nr:hypothetical protein [Myxococcales bacterium]